MTTYDETTAAALLDAGAVLPPGSTDREDADVLTVRTYTHPALDERKIVRLVPATLGEAEDLALDFLGLVREPETPEVGQVRKETLGFPAWALVNDPANGHHALALVKDVERLARQAKSRPGTAKEGFEALGERLGRAVPHFLPTFYEQAARVFLQHENTTYAAAFFGKAREAERVHALAVDEERQRAVFLEFAFAGALTVKALKEHVKALAARLDPADAWAQFRQLTVERCAAGMPPYASLPQDARGLIKAAGLNRVTEECALVADLLASPAAVRAPASFWNTYRATLVVLAEQQPAVRARLLEIMPAGLGRTTEDDEFWLALLAETGADLLLTGESEAADGVDAADWLSRWALHRKHGGSVSGRSPATLALVERMAPRLRAQGRPVDLFTGRWHAGADLDLLDLCVAEGVPLTLPGADQDVFLPLNRWLTETLPGRRDLTATAADPRCRGLLYVSVGTLSGHRPDATLLEGLAGHPVLADVLREWLENSAAELTAAAGLPAARAALDRLRPFRTVAARVSPAAVAEVAAHEVAPLLGRTLRAGIPDELGWPALDEALPRLDAETRQGRDDTLIVEEAWPALILFRRHKAIVVGPQEILLEHELRLPVELDRWQRPSFRYADGELLVMWRQDSKQFGYWSARPTEVFPLGGERLAHWYGGGDAGETSIPLPGGGRATGGRALHAGDTVLPAGRRILGDGTSYWRQGRQGLQQVWLEYDPATGTHGRASLPAFLRSGIREDATLLQQHCAVLPLQPGLEHSPFGTDGTVLGRWVRREGEGAEARTTAGTPDGRTVSVPTAPGRVPGVPVGALRLPGGAEPVVVALHRQVALYAGDGTSGAVELGRVTPLERGGEFAAGTRLVPPVDFWHALRPRDESASAILRALSDEQAGELLRTGAQALAERAALVAAAGASAAAASGGRPTGASTGAAVGRPAGASAAAADDKPVVPTADEVLREAVSRSLPALTEPHLLTGVASLVRAVLRLAESTAAFVAPPVERPRVDRRRAEGMFSDYSPEYGDDQTLREATADLADQQGWWGGDQRWSALRQIRAVNHVLSGKPADGKPLPERSRLTATADGWQSDDFTIPGIGLVWLSVLDALRPLAYRAASPALTETHREALLLLFEAVTDGPLAAPGGALREVLLSEPHDKQERVGQVLRRQGRTVVVLGCQNVDRQAGRVNWLALDHDPAGVFGAVAHFTLEKETAHPPVFPADALAALTRLVRDKGAAPWQAEAPETLAAATGGGLGPVQAALLLAGKPAQLTDEVVAATGLKPRQKDLGDGLLASLGAGNRAALIGALLPENLGDLWTSGPDTGAAGRVWAERFDGVVRLPEDLAGELSLAGLPTGSAEEVLNPARTPWISRTTVLRRDKDGDLVPEDPRALPGRWDLSRAAPALAAAYFPGDRDVLGLLPGHLLGVVRKDDPADAARLRGYWDGPVRRRAEQGSATWRTLWDLRTVLEG
ncbi:DNA-binding protein OS=Streptomyces aurantiogriseus OX=66870 GN=GCM10010251_60810 PE=4 SV=1 [Streptomyces aurantiogriseus]